ncbi:MAG: hypothetical protein RI897_1234 [Verrucomicrobiota bacterium]|jgi:4-amino-4-deoxy-L-arabinose transferase-like glycosyltransferase
MDSDSKGWSRHFWQVFWILLVLRVLFAVVFPLDFAGDEAYYWDWGRRLDWGYYSKPPMVAWLMAFAGWVGNDSYVVIKLVPVLLTASGVAAMFLLTRMLYGARSAVWVGVMFLVLPATAVLSILLTIDPPLFLCWSLALLFAWRWLNAGERGGWLDGLGLMVALGCGYLSKPIQLVFPVMLLVFLGVSREDRKRLRRPSLYVILLGSLLFLLPVVYWNAQHGWITFSHTAYHFEKPDLRLGKMIARPFEFLGSQMALCSPVLWFLLLAGVVSTALRWKQVTRREHFLLCFCAPMLLVVHLMSTWQRVHPNWPLVFYVSAFVLLGGWTQGVVAVSVRLERWGKFLARGVWVSVGFSVAMYLAVFVVGLTPLAGAKGDPTERLRGWKELGEEVGKVMARLPRPEETLVITPSRRQLASQLAYYMPGRPRVYRLENPERINSQYGIWGGPAGHAGWDALIVGEGAEGGDLPPELVGAFESVEPLDPVHVVLGSSGIQRSVRLWHARGFRQWPYPLP